jgi:hypothetical protein
MLKNGDFVHGNAQAKRMKNVQAIGGRAKNVRAQ